jgi:hypothetical protein
MQDKLKIAGLDYEIKLEKYIARDSGALGMHCGNSAIIKVDADLRGSVKQKVLLHEVLEAINYEYELKLEHEKLSVLDSALFEIIKNKENAWLLKYIGE